MPAVSTPAAHPKAVQTRSPASPVAPAHHSATAPRPPPGTPPVPSQSPAAAALPCRPPSYLSLYRLIMRYRHRQLVVLGLLATGLIAGLALRHLPADPPITPR